MMHNMLQNIFRKRSTANMLAVVCAVVVGLVGGEINRHRAEKQYQLFLNNQVQKVLLKLESETMRSSAMAVAGLLGLNEPLLKRQVLGQLAPDDKRTLARLDTARIMLNADGIYVMDKKGLVLAHASEKDRFTGKNFSFRPYWQQAMNGIRNVYPAVGTVSHKRGLYVAAPIRSGKNPSGPVIGVVVIKVSGEYLDSLFSSFGEKVIMMSPQGVIFAASDSNWLYQPALRLSAKSLAEIRKRKQFGGDFGRGKASMTPLFDVSEERVAISGDSYAKAIAPIQLNDPAGKWSLILLSPVSKAFPLMKRVTVYIVYGAIVWIVLMMGLRAVRYSVASQDALNRSEDSAKELQNAIDMKERHAGFTERMQRARDVVSMVATFFEELASFIPIHQGSLYFVETDDDGEARLTLAGSYGTMNLPEHIPLGEGLMGQCAVDRQVKFLTEVPDGFWRVSSGLGSALPHALLMMPVKSGEHFLGVVEIASLSSDFDGAAQQIESMMPSLAMNLEILLAEKRTQRMLVEAQSNAETYKNWQEVGREAENWLYKIIDQVPDGILISDEAGQIRFSNRAIERLLGYGNNELARMQVSQVVVAGPDDQSLDIKTLFDGIPEAGPRLAQWRAGFKLQCKDKTTASVSISFSRLPGMGLHDPGICMVLRSA